MHKLCLVFAAALVAPARPLTLVDTVGGLVGSAKAAGVPGLWGTMVALDMVPGLPTQPATLAAGATLGFWPGLVATSTAQTTAAALSLQVARRLGREGQLLGDFVAQMKDNGGATGVISAVAEKVDGTDPNGDWRRPFTALYIIRNSPIVPFTIGNYLLGATTKAPIPPLLLATFLGCLPANCLYVAAGAGLGAIATGAAAEVTPLETAVGVLGVVATVVITAAGADVLKKSMNAESEAS
mmetsp:Transcript_2940/g.11915  ORF Transcript_2940/g.11915 Transcript_2940/m.11915 type:complete len:240 (-) Transcript_2940:173-892(-)